MCPALLLTWDSGTTPICWWMSVIRAATSPLWWTSMKVQTSPWWKTACPVIMSPWWMARRMRRSSSSCWVMWTPPTWLDAATPMPVMYRPALDLFWADLPTQSRASTLPTMTPLWTSPTSRTTPTAMSRSWSKFWKS